MAEWLYETGIGEARAILVEDGRISEAHVELPGLRAGSVVSARLTTILIPRRRGIATLDDGSEILIEPLAPVTEGATVHVAIIREAIAEPGAVKRAKGQLTDAEPCDGPDLAARIGRYRRISLHEEDAFEAAGWSECLEQAASGLIPFDGGMLRISLTPAMTLIDIDGDDALAGAEAAAQAIRRYNLTGNIGIDLPTVAGKAQRQAIAAAADAVLPRPYERTSVNGFGFLQIIRPRLRASLLEIVQNDLVGAAARALLRGAQRSGIIGASELVVAPALAAFLAARDDWIEALARELGGDVTIRADHTKTIVNGTFHRIG